MKRIGLTIVLALFHIIVFAQRYTGYGRGMDAGDDWDFSPSFKLLLFIIIIGICIVGGFIGLLKEKLDVRKEKKVEALSGISKREEDNKNAMNGGITDSNKKANNTMTPVVVKTWNLISFAKTHGKMQVGDFQNKETGEMFKSCIFTHPDGTRVFVAFSSRLGELSPKEIAAMKDELVVVQLESGNYSLCKRDTNWDDLDFDKDENDATR